MRPSTFTHGLLAAAVAMTLAACAGGDSDDSPDDVRADLSEELQESLRLTADEADCYAEILVDEVGAADLQDIDFTAEEPSEGMQEQLAAAALEAVDRCDLEATDSSG